MPRWTSILTAAAAALVAAPVGTHYLSTKNATPSALVAASTQDAPPDRVIRTTKAIQKGSLKTSGGSGNRSVPSASMLDTLHHGEDDAQAEGKEAIAGMMCAYTQGNRDGSGHCPAGPAKDATVIIAVVPDPVHTHLALRFDREMDTIGDSLQQLGWIYDRSWLPWDNTAHKAPDRWEARTFDSAAQSARESLPGVLLFRPMNGAAFGPDTKKPPSQHLIVLLVGEKPTSGVNAGQLEQALNYWAAPATLFNGMVVQQPSRSQRNQDSKLKRISGRSRPTQEIAGVPKSTYPASNLVVLGPNFSGSLYSLDSILTRRFGSPAACGTQHHVFVISGEVSDGQTLKAINEKPRSCGMTVNARSFSSNYLVRKQQIESFFQPPHANVQLAFVSENESSYGANESAKPPQEQTGAPKQGAAPPMISTAFRFAFPREISRLRRAYEKNGVIGFSQSSDTPRTGLQLVTAEDGSEGDSLENFSSSTGVIAMEAKMAGLGRSLTANHVEVAIVSATDVLDEIFVARYLLQHVPDLSIVIQDSDQLFLHEETDASMNNVYVASPWPLIEENDMWTQDLKQPNQSAGAHGAFGSEADEGIYTAVAYALRCSPVTAECATDSYREYRSPFAGSLTNEAKSSPPLWLSVIEHGRFQPVAVVNDRRQNTENLPALSTSESKGIGSGRTNLSTKLLAAGIIGLLLWHGWACHKCGLNRSFAWTYALAEQQHHRIRLMVKSAISMIAGVALALLFLPDSPGLHLQSDLFHVCLVGGQLLAVYLASLSIHKLAVFEASQSPWWTAIGFGVAGLFALLLMDAFFWHVLALFVPASGHLLFRYRASLPFSGASPLLPLLLITASFALMLHSCFARLAFYGHRIPQLPQGFDYLRCPSDASLKPLTKLLSNVCDGRRLRSAATCLCVMVVFVFLVLERRGLLSLGGGAFDTMMTVCTIITGAFILQNLAMASLAWRLLKHKLLIPLRQSPLRWGFTWIKGFSWRRIWRSSKTLSSNQIFDYLTRLLQGSSRIPGSGTGAQYYREICLLYAGADAGASIQAFTDGMTELHVAMKKEAETRLASLQNAWQSDRGPLTGNESHRGIHLLKELDKLEAGERLTALQRMADEEFVALLYVGYISMVMIQIRQRILTAAVLYVLLLWTLTCYPWMYRHTILLGLVAMFAVLAGVTLIIYTEMFRDDILSRTTETTSGKLDGGFFEKIVPVLGLPLLTLIASQFPEVSNFLFSWVGPGLSKF